MNLGRIEAELYDRLSLKSAPPTDTVAKLRRYINTVYRGLMAKKHLAPYRRSVLSFASVANSPYAVLPQAATRFHGIQNRSNQQILDSITISEMRLIDPGNSRSSSTPEAFAVMNYASAVARQPSDASELFFKSSSASDGATKEVFVEGITSGGYVRLASAAMNGVTAVSLGASITDWIEIRKFYVTLAAGGTTTAAGSITLHEDSGSGTELARISIGRAFPRYTMIQLYPYPSSAVTFWADVDLHIEDLVEYTDEPLFDEDHHELIIEGVLMREYELRSDPAPYSQAKARYKDRWGSLCEHVSREIASRQPPRRFSQLGSWFSEVS